MGITEKIVDLRSSQGEKRSKNILEISSFWEALPASS
jgi:hypothetical protein